MKKNNAGIFLISILAIIIIIPIVILILVNRGDNKVEEDLLGIDFNTKENTVELSKYETENPLVAMYIENYGAIVIELYPKIAPNTVNNFISLTKKGFYDNNTFHRLVPGFVLQGGDPNGSGTGGPGYNIKGEFKANNFENDLKHEKKIVSMARSQDYDSAGSQFFIMLADSSSLDGQYAAFGKVIDGWKNIEKIIKNEKIADEESGKLEDNLTIKKALVDTKGREYSEVEKVKE